MLSDIIALCFSASSIEEVASILAWLENEEGYTPEEIWGIIQSEKAFLAKEEAERKEQEKASKLLDRILIIWFSIGCISLLGYINDLAKAIQPIQPVQPQVEQVK